MKAVADITEQLLARYQRKNAAREPVHASDSAPRREAYLQAACVLHCFALEALGPISLAASRENPRDLLFDDIVRAPGARSNGLFTLKLHARRAGLRQLGTREAMRAALKANPERPLTSLQRLWESYLDAGALPDPQTLGYRKLAELCQILGWLDDIFADLPDQRQMLALVRKRSVLSSFEHLVAENFVGRVDELTQLREHIEALSPETGVKAVRRQLRRWLRVRPKPILAIHGPGGVGKSALVGRMLWEHAQAETRAPFAYLAFDQPTLRAETPFTLLVEATGQLALQLPEHDAAFEQFARDVREFRDLRGAAGAHERSYRTRGERLRDVHDADRALYESFGRLLHTIATRSLDSSTVQSPVLLVLDSFEEVQYRDRETLARLWRMLETIQQAYPPLRLVISGRSPVSELSKPAQAVEEVRLGELALEDRILLLERLGVTDPKLARSVAQQVGGNPLSLRLAANVVSSDRTGAGAAGISELSTRKWLVFQVDEQLIQGQLYGRILNHIHDPNVRKIAHPGMVLRRVTPDIILNVLAPLFLEDVADTATAYALFEQLRREHALVTPGSADELVYRADIRRAVVRNLVQDRYSEVRRLHREAIRYYSEQDTVEGRAEEIYHRLALGEDEPSVLEGRWTTGVDISVIASLEEYSDRAKAWLASRMSLEVPRAVLMNAATADWERNATRKVQRALSELELDWALALLSERSERTPGSPLFALETKALMLNGDHPAALRAIERGIEQVSDSSNRGRLAELYWLQSQVHLLLQQPQAADVSLARAELTIEHAADRLPLMHVLCHRLLLREQHPVEYVENSAPIRARLNEVCKTIADWSDHSSLFVPRLAVVLLGAEFPQTSRRLDEVVGGRVHATADALTSDNLQGIDPYREPWEIDSRPEMEAFA